MTTTTTQINITAKDSTAGAFASANNNLSSLASSALKASAVLSTIGAGAVVSSMAAFAKQTLDAQDELFKLSQKTGVAVESLAGLEFAAEQSGVELEKVAKATRVFRELVVEAADSSSEAAKKLSQLGLSYKDLKDLSPEKQLLALADALSKFGKEDRPIALTSVLGQKMADLIPLLSNGSSELQKLIDQGKKLNPVTEESARKAEQFNDQMNLLSKSVSALGREMVQGLIPSFARITDEMVKVTQQSGFLSGALAGVKQLWVESFGNPKILGDVGQIRREIFKTQDAINSLEKKRGSFFFDENALLHEKEKLVALQNDLQGAIVKSREVVAAQDANTESTKRFTVALDTTNKPLATRGEKIDLIAKKMADQSRIESEYVKLLVIERKAQADLLKPYHDSAQSAQDRLDSMLQEAKALDLSQKKQISLEQAIELTTIARLEEKKAITSDTTAVAEIQKEITARKQIISVIQQSEARTKALATVNHQTTDQVSQLWIQAGRNIQSALANSIFNFFDDGLKGMVRNVKDAVLRILSEFAALKIAQSLGLTGLFGGSAGGLISGGGSVAGLFGGIGGSGGSAGISAMNISTLGSNGAGLLRTGFGATGLTASTVEAIGAYYGSAYLSAFGAGMNGVGSVGATAGIFSNAGGAGTAFIGGQGTALGGTGMGTAATMGARFGTGIATAGAAALGVTLGTLIAGNKKIMGMDGATTSSIGALVGGGIGVAAGAGGGVAAGAAAGSVVPVIGTIIGAIVGGLVAAGFGHGPYKFRQQSLQGEVSSGGIDGSLTNVYRSKGGFFVSNRHKSFESEIPDKLESLIDKTIQGYFKSVRKFTENLGFSADLVDNYTEQIQIKSEKGKQITEEQVKSIFDTLADNVAKRVIPNIEQFSFIGEKAGDTFARLNSEFVSLVNGVENLGASVAYAKQIVSSMSIEARSAFVEQAGGIERINQLSAGFFDGFLTEQEKLGVRTDQLSDSLSKLGLSTNLTKEQFKSLVQSTDTSNDLRIALLELVPAFLAVRNAQNQLIGVTNDLVDSELNLTSLRSELLASYGKERNELESTIDKFKNISSTLREFKNSLALGQLSPLTPAQKLEEARAQFNRTRALADKGDQGALADLPRVSQEFLQASQTYNASSAAYISDFNLVKSVLDKASTAALTQSEISQKQLDELKSTVEYLTGIKDEARTTNEILKDLLAATLNSKGNAGISTKDIQNYLQANPNMTAKDIANAAIKYGVSKDQLVAAGIKSESINKYTGGATVSDKDILDFVNSGATPMQIYQAAVANGVTSARLSKVTGISMTDINKFVKDNHLQSFAKGTDFIAKTGIVMAHRGEAIVPSSTTEEIKKLREELAKLRQEQNQQTGDMMKITDLSNQRNAKMIADALAQIENRRQWNDKSKVRLA